MRSTPSPVVLAASTLALVACAWRDGEPAVRVIPDPAGLRATSLLDAADTAMAHGKRGLARAALVTAYDQPTASPGIAYRVARLAGRLDDVGTEARAYRRYLSLAPVGPVADTVRTRLLALVSGPLREVDGGASAAAVTRAVAVAELEWAGEVGRAADDSAAGVPSPVSGRPAVESRGSHPSPKPRRTRHRR